MSHVSSSYSVFFDHSQCLRKFVVGKRSQAKGSSVCRRYFPQTISAIAKQLLESKQYFVRSDDILSTSIVQLAAFAPAPRAITQEAQRNSLAKRFENRGRHFDTRRSAPFALCFVLCAFAVCVSEKSCGHVEQAPLLWESFLEKCSI